MGGVIVRVDARQCEVRHQGEVLPAAMRGRLFDKKRLDKVPVAVGDHVLVTQEGDGLAITEVLPRENLFGRCAAGDDHRRQILATNLDQVVHVACFGTPPFSSLTSDRILVAAEAAGIPSVLVVNKTDLDDRELATGIQRTYAAANTEVILTSAETKQGVDELSACLTGKQSLLYGLSGVGKSTLLNQIDPGLDLKTREVSGALHAGRHTTTFAKMYDLALGGTVIDTPGVRSFRPFGIPANELRLHFPEMALLGRQCKFSGCLHQKEPKCQVRTAHEEGDIATSRFRSYLSILQEINEA